MKNTFKLTGLVIIILAIITSCTKDLVTDSLIGDNYSIKSVYADGKTYEKFIYNDIGKITEYQGFHFCSKYNYDSNGRLIKQEVAVDPDIASSTFHIRTELMTAQNSTFTGNYYFEYSTDGKLSVIKNYFKTATGQFEFTSMTGLEYKGDNIVKSNLYNAKNIVTQYHTYEYDSNGNVTKEKYYSFLFTTSPGAELISEKSHKYDNKNNPFKIYSALGNPGLYTNTNNIIETNSVLYIDVPGINENSTSKTTYEYNDKGFPVKVINDNSAYEYKYD